jgi:hypothetical protein
MTKSLLIILKEHTLSSAVSSNRRNKVSRQLPSEKRRMRPQLQERLLTEMIKRLLISELLALKSKRSSRLLTLMISNMKTKLRKN